MDIKIRIMVVASIITFTNCLNGMEKKDCALKIYTIPGLGGERNDGGSSKEYVSMLFQGHDCTFREIVTPDDISDLGQEGCVDHVYNAIVRDQRADAANGIKPKKRVIHATSRGVATTFNMGEKLADLGIDCVIGEGAYPTGNLALKQSVHGSRAGRYGVLKNVPFLDIWLPYLAKLVMFSQYNPAGLQPIDAVSKIPAELLIILIHGTLDQRAHHDGAEAIYAALQHHNRNNTYFISKKDGDHIHLLEKQDVPALQSILRKRGILPLKQGEAQEQIDVTQYQPEFSQYIARYHAIRAEQTMHKRIEQGVRAATIVAGVAVTYWALKTLLNRQNHTAPGDAAATLTGCIQNATPDAAFYVSNILASLD